MQAILRHGILGETGFTYIAHDGVKSGWCHTGDTIHTMKHIGDIYELALSCGLQRIWVHTSIPTFENMPDSFISDASEGYHTGDANFLKYSYFDVYRKQKDYSYEVGIHFTSHPYSKWRIRHPLDGECLERGEVVTDKELYITVAYLENLLQIPLRYSTGYIGQSLIRATNTGYKAKNLQVCEADLTPFIQSTGASRPFHRPLTEGELSLKWIHAIDKNANFLGSSSIQLGIGSYEHVSRPIFDKNELGLWLVTVEGSSLYEGEAMPSASTILLSQDRKGLLYTSTIQLLLELGYQITFHEAMLWPKDRRALVLGEWSKRLSHAYTELRTNFTSYKNVAARGLAKEMLKGMYVKGLSWFSMDIEDNRGNYLDMPHWYHFVIAEAYQKMIRNIMTYEKMLGLSPLLMNNDELIYASDIQDITQALPNLRMEKKPSHYKLEYSIPLEEGKHLFTRENSNAFIRDELKKIARQHGYTV